MTLTAQDEENDIYDWKAKVFISFENSYNIYIHT